MRIVFWQHILSMIDLPYIVELINYSSVNEVVIVANGLSENRKDMGWDIDFPELKKCLVVTNPNSNEIDTILKKDVSNSIHLFSGLNAFPLVFHAFKMSLKYNLKRGIITERPLTYCAGLDWLKPLWLHRLRYWLYNKKYIKYINYYFEIGECTSHYYKSISSQWTVFPFAYCTRENKELTPSAKSKLLQICFVGSLCKRKDVITLLRAVKIMNDKGYKDLFEVKLIGSGEEERKLKEYATSNQLYNVSFLGTKPNNELPLFLVSQDVFVLPSIHDGWGAVLNEALQAGLYTICSDRCGGQEMINEPYLGEVFNMGDYKQLANILKLSIENIGSIRSLKEKRRLWAKKSISGIVIATYLLSCLNGDSPAVPWYKNEYK